MSALEDLDQGTPTQCVANDDFDCAGSDSFLDAPGGVESGRTRPKQRTHCESGEEESLPSLSPKEIPFSLLVLSITYHLNVGKLWGCTVAKHLRRSL